MRRSGNKKGKGGLQNARKLQEQKKLMCRPQPLPVIPVTVMQNAQIVDLHTKTLIVMVRCGSVVIIVTPGIICRVQMSMVLKFQQSLYVLTASRSIIIMFSNLVIVLYGFCIFLFIVFVQQFMMFCTQ